MRLRRQRPISSSGQARRTFCDGAAFHTCATRGCCHHAGRRTRSPGPRSSEGGPRQEAPAGLPRGQVTPGHLQTTRAGGPRAQNREAPRKPNVAEGRKARRGRPRGLVAEGRPLRPTSGNRGLRETARMRPQVGPSKGALGAEPERPRPSRPPRPRPPGPPAETTPPFDHAPRRPRPLPRPAPPSEAPPPRPAPAGTARPSRPPTPAPPHLWPRALPGRAPLALPGPAA